MIKLEYKGNLEKDIKSFKRKFDFEKSFKKHLLNDTIISAVMTLVGVYGFKLDVFNSFSKVFITVAVLSAMSMIKEKVEINVSKKKAIRNLRGLSKELNNYTGILNKLIANEK